MTVLLCDAKEWKANAYIADGGSINKVVVQICEKIYRDRLRALFVCESADTVNEIDDMLWTSTRLFLPHGTKNSPYTQQQTIFLATSNDLPSYEYDCIITLNITVSDIAHMLHKYRLAAHIFDLANEQLKILIGTYTQLNRSIIVWRQSNGAWSRA